MILFRRIRRTGTGDLRWTVSSAAYGHDGRTFWVGSSPTSGIANAFFAVPSPCWPPDFSRFLVKEEFTRNYALKEKLPEN